MNISLCFPRARPASVFALVLAGLLISSCAPSDKTRSFTTPPESSPFSSSSPWVEETLSRLSVEEKVGQLIHVWTLSPYMARESAEWQNLLRLTKERKLGGFIFSIGDVYEYAVQLNKLQAEADIPLLIGVDFEWGPGMRIRNSTTFPRAMALGATRDPDLAYKVGKATALESRAVGVHQNYAPVMDVNNNPRNPVINTRAFGDDVDLVATMGLAFVRGTQDGHVIATVKHFPGHGDTDIDTHLGLTELNFTRERFEKVELRPFREAISGGVYSVMVGHLAAPLFDTASGIPATVSSSLTTTLLQQELGFNGLIVTDAMEMRAVTRLYKPGEAAILAIQAGNDLVLMPNEPEVALDAVVAAVKRGEIPESRIDRSVRKLLQVKEWLGLATNRFVNIDEVADVVASPAHQRLAKEVARKSITVLGNKDGLLPLVHADTSSILDIVFADRTDPSVGWDFHSQLRGRHRNLEFARIDPRSNAIDYDSTLSMAQNADLVICQFHFHTRSGQMTGFIPDTMSALVNRIIASGVPVIGVSFGNPYVVTDFPDIGTYVCAYSSTDVIAGAAAEVLFGESPATGKLPIAIPGAYKFGDGIEYPKVSLGEATPAEVGFDPDAFARIDGVVQDAIRDSAFPGAVLLVAKDGMVVHNKGYGTFEYGPASRAVTARTIFDLASVTKVIATTSSVMRLVDEGRLSLDDAAVRYIPAFGQNGKDHITIYDLLVHRSGLPAWRKFYEFCDTPECVLDSVYATPLEFPTGERTVYSDLGLITVGKIIETISGVPLDAYVDSVFFKPLGMNSTMFNPPETLHNWIVPTEVDDYWQKTGIAVRGRVHDENAATLGGVSGHAGLFSTGSDLAIFLQMLLNEGTYAGKSYLRAETIRRFVTRQSPSSTRGIGWDTKSETGSFSGSFTSMKTYLHTGFTGTSVVVDPEKNLIIVFLTNRVYPTRNTRKIYSVRPLLHDTIVGSLTPAQNQLIRNNSR